MKGLLAYIALAVLVVGVFIYFLWPLYGESILGLFSKPNVRLVSQHSDYKIGQGKYYDGAFRQEWEELLLNRPVAISGESNDTQVPTNSYEKLNIIITNIEQHRFPYGDLRIGERWMAMSIVGRQVRSGNELDIFIYINPVWGSDREEDFGLSFTTIWYLDLLKQLITYNLQNNHPIDTFMGERHNEAIDYDLAQSRVMQLRQTRGSDSLPILVERK